MIADKIDASDDLIQKVILEVSDSKDPAKVAGLLDKLAATPESPLNLEFTQANSHALRTGDWSMVTELFSREEFLGPSHKGLIIANYTTRREGHDSRDLSALYFEVLPYGHPASFFEPFIYQIFGTLEQPIPHVMPIALISASGGFSLDDSTEAFIVPDGWGFDGSETGPALNDLSRQSFRFETAIKCVERVFEPESASLLTSQLSNETVRLEIQSLEYQAHDAGHATGIGLRSKLTSNVLTNGWHRGVEEWRSDGVAFEIASRAFSEDILSHMIASNLMIRFGVDAHRQGKKADTDYNSCLLLFSQLLHGGCLTITEANKLSFVNKTRRGLASSVELMRASAVALTRKELRSLRHPAELANLYGSVALDDCTVALFETIVVNPCTGLFARLR